MVEPSKRVVPRWVLIAYLCACTRNDAHPPDAHVEHEALLSSDADLYTLSARQLERLFAQLPTRYAGASAELAREGVRVARAHARVSGRCGLCASVRGWVEVALALGAATGCESALQFAQLLAKEGNDRNAAVAFARLVRRTAQRGDQAACVAAAEELGSLLPGAPAPDAAGPANDPHSLDPSAFLAEQGARRGGLLQELRVYGAGPNAGQVRVVLALDGPAPFRSGELPADDPLPRRVFLDLAGIALAPGAHAALSVGAAGLSRVRAFVLDDKTTRVSFDVDDATLYHVFFLADPYRVIVDFRHELSPEQARLAATRPTIVLDPGHGGAQVGAHGPNGLEEAKVALSIALRVRRLLARALPELNVVMTRDSDRAVSLEERAAIANAVDARLFVSVHLNASSSVGDKGGVSTYVLDTSDDAQALKLSARENDAAESDVTALQRLFAGLYRKEQVGHSLELAQAVHAATLKWGRRQLPRLADRGVKKALFYVLVGARMPAVLCESSFITRPDEAAALATDAYRQAIAEGIAEGITNYLRPRHL